MKYKISPYYDECVRWFEESGLKMGIEPFSICPHPRLHDPASWGPPFVHKASKTLKIHGECVLE